VTLSIQIAARDNSVVQQSITSKKIEELVRTTILPGVTPESCVVTAIDNTDATETLCTKPKKGSVDCVASTIPLHGSG
jgi:hypothetical protein